MTLDELYVYLRKFFGYKAEVLAQRDDKQEIDIILYDSFFINCGFDERGSFGAGLCLPNNVITTSFCGYCCSLVENNEQSIEFALKKIDEYCHLRLPDKYLEMYDKVYKEKGHYLRPTECRR